VVDADAEAEDAHGGGVGVAGELGEDAAGPGVIGGVELLEAKGVVAAAAAPGDVAEVEAVVDAEVLEGGEAVLVDGVPEAELGGDAVVEPVEDGEAGGALGGFCEPRSSRGWSRRVW
jgi:hypothetical protein